MYASQTQVLECNGLLSSLGSSSRRTDAAGVEVRLLGMQCVLPRRPSPRERKQVAMRMDWEPVAFTQLGRAVCVRRLG